MHKVLAKFGFKEDFISWVIILYKNICSSVINNGWQSRFFNMSRGTKQGYPLSALIFIIIVEILATKFRSSETIEGITVNENNLKITQLADDTTLFLKDQNEITHALHIVEEFGTFSGLKLNKSKTEGILIGRLKNNMDTFIENIKFTTKVKALGTYFGTDKSDIVNLN